MRLSDIQTYGSKCLYTTKKTHKKSMPDDILFLKSTLSYLIFSQNQFCYPLIISSDNAEYFWIQSMSDLPVDSLLDIISTVKSMNHFDPVSSSVCPAYDFFNFRNGFVYRHSVNIQLYDRCLQHVDLLLYPVTSQVPVS